MEQKQKLGWKVLWERSPGVFVSPMAVGAQVIYKGWGIPFGIPLAGCGPLTVWTTRAAARRFREMNFEVCEENRHSPMWPVIRRVEYIPTEEQPGEPHLCLKPPLWVAPGMDTMRIVRSNHESFWHSQDWGWYLLGPKTRLASKVRILKKQSERR